MNYDSNAWVAIKGFFSLLFYVGFGGLWVSGIFHGANKHSAGDGIMSAFIPPWGIYRGVEQFWHKNGSDINWDKRMKSDYESLFYYLNESEKVDVETQRSVESFSIEVSSYPKDKRDSLKQAADCYMLFMTGLFDDLESWASRFEIDSTATFHTSSKTEAFQERLKNQYNFDQQPTVDAIQKMADDAKENWEIDAPLMAKVSGTTKKTLEKPMGVYKEIFNEDYKFTTQ